MRPTKTITVKLTDSEGNMFCPLHVCLDSYKGSDALSDGDLLEIETYHQFVTFKYDSEKADFTEVSSGMKQEFGI